mmetsp:Transcript_24556/g.66967  ORF Transcript_24556/g.66967 Transcript_24556/m.66967 type:complete len:114 (+) Transcript_24556:225-566(+)
MCTLNQLAPTNSARARAHTHTHTHKHACGNMHAYSTAGWLLPLITVRINVRLIFIQNLPLHENHTEGATLDCMLHLSFSQSTTSMRTEQRRQSSYTRSSRMTPKKHPIITQVM